MSRSSDEWVDVLLVAAGDGGEGQPVWMDAIESEYEVGRANSVEAARGVLEASQVGCVVVDGAGSDDALSRLVASAERTKVLAVVGDDDATARLRTGANDVLPRDGGDDAVAVARNRIAEALTWQQTTERVSLASKSRDALVSEASVPVLLIAQDGRIIEATEGAAEYLGRDSAEDLVGMEMPSVVHEDDRERALERFERVIEDLDAVPEAELRLSKPNGGTVYAAVSTSPAYHDGELVAQAVARDVTDRYDPVQALTGKDAVVPSALNVLQDVLFVIDADGELRFWNDALCETTGYDDAEIAAMDPDGFFPEDDAEAAIESLKAVFEEGVGTLEAPLLRKDGESVPCEFRGRAVENEAGDVVGIVGLGRDVRERKRREQALRTLNTVGTELKDCETPTAAAERTVAVATEVLDMEFCDVSLIDDAGTHLEVAAATEALDEDATMRMDVEEGVAGLTFRSGRSFLVDDLDEFDEVEPKGEFHSLVSVPVGEYGVFQAVAEAAGAFDETDLELVELLAGHCETALDRIEREATLRDRTASLQAQNERLDEFASVVSHDLRNPLTLLQAELEMAEETGAPESFDRVRDAIVRMDDLIEDLLSLARAGEGVAETELVSVESAAVQCWGTVSATGGTLNVDSSPTVEADPTRLRQLLENLFRNSVEHGQIDDGDVTVTVGSLPKDAGFFVADDGVGIPEGERDRVFESGYTTAQDGTGFGLRIVEDVADANGWCVSVTESDAGGARFEIRTD